MKKLQETYYQYKEIIQLEVKLKEEGRESEEIALMNAEGRSTGNQVSTVELWQSPA